jgi:hypothetical protein
VFSEVGPGRAVARVGEDAIRVLERLEHRKPAARVPARKSAAPTRARAHAMIVRAEPRRLWLGAASATPCEAECEPLERDRGARWAVPAAVHHARQQCVGKCGFCEGCKERVAWCG